jgi:tetratricopeptide (TPR) repeat protein
LKAKILHKQKTINKNSFYLIGIVMVLLLAACSTKKHTFFHRNYHNVTAKYNGYFHAREIVKEAQKRIEKEHKDDYRKILPVYSLGDDATAKSIVPDMEKAFKKCSEVIKYHSILIKGKEYCDWIDNTYFVIGQTHYFKKEYYISAEVFDYVAKQYKAKDTKHLAMLWQLRSYNENGSFANAQMILDLLNSDRSLPKNLKADLAIAHADYLMKRESYSLAAEQLEKALVLTKNKSQRARITFILAQLYQRTEQYRKASRLYSDVIALNPKYEMTFQAKINRAKCTESDGRNSKGIKEELIKMAKDAKNKEYLDQIYYTLAELEIKEKNEKKALFYLKESVANSVSDNYQKSLSYLKLGELHFEMPEYELSQAYYDSTVSVLPKDFPNYDLIVERKNSLTELIKNLKMVAFQDSMLRISAMSEEERDRYAERMIEKAIEDEKKKQEEEELKKQQQLLTQNNPAGAQQQNQGQGSSWYFYNPATVNFGITDFKKKWGERKLEDNWRRSNKTSVSFDEPEDDETDETASGTDTTGIAKTKKTSDIKSKEFYLQDVPLTPEKINASHEKIKDALYNCGTIYKEQLQDMKQAILAFEEIINRYDTSKFHLPLYYQIYRLSMQVGDNARAEKYKNILLTKHPNTPYAKLINDPDYLKNAQAELSEIEQYYASTYELYSQKQYAQVIGRSAQADSLFPKNKFTPQFHFMKAMSLGALKGPDVLEEELKKLIVLHPQNKVKKEAEEILETIYAIKSSSDTTTVDNATPFTHKKDEAHTCILIVKDKNKDLSDAKNAVSDFNALFYPTKQLNTTSTFLGTENQMIIISSLENKTEAMKYYNNIISETAISAALGSSHQIFVISGENFQMLFKEKNLTAYQDFFERRYLNKKKQ